MRKNGKKLTAIMMSLAMAATATACGGEANETTTTPAPSGNETTPEATKAPESNGGETTETTPAPEATPEATPVPEKYQDLGGMDILIGDWWSSGEFNPQSQQEEDTLAYRNEIQSKYNFTINQLNVGGWGAGIQEVFVTGVMANDPVAQLFILGAGFVNKPLANGLMYDLATIETLDFTEDKWNTSVVDSMTFGSSIYGMATGKPEPRTGVFWNKRMFEEAGLDRDLPYDLQASGEWTWAKFEEICETLSRDTNGDGILDYYALCSQDTQIMAAALMGNNAKYVDTDANGKIVNTSGSPETLESLNWAVSLFAKKYQEPKQDPDEPWDYFKGYFHDGKAAMIIEDEYTVGTWADMEDDWGFVLVPYNQNNPQAKSQMIWSDNIFVMPSCFDADTANKIAFAYNLYSNPTPGYEDADDWMSTYYPVFRDERAVEETLAMAYEPGRSEAWVFPFVYGLSVGDIAWTGIFDLAVTPAEVVESIAPTWQSYIDDFNNN